LAQLYVGQGLQEKGDKAMLDLAEQLRKGRSEAEERIIKNLTPQIQTTEMAGPYTGNVSMPTMQTTVPPNYEAAVREIRTNPYGAGKEYLPSILKNVIPEPVKPTTDMQNYQFAKEQGFKGSFNDFKQQITPYQQEQLKLDREKFEFEKTQKNNEIAPAFNNNGMPVGRFDKQGRYISPQGRVYNASAVNEAQKEHDVATDLVYKLNQLTDKDIKNAFGSLTDYTASKTGQMLGRKEVVTAQNKINAIQIKNVLDNLSQLKGASSDKEMAQMIKDFPSYTASPQTMEAWVERAAKATNRFLKRSENRFGFDTEYATEGRFGEKQKPEQSVAPQGVDQALWNAMTPQERALWQK